MNAGGQGKGPQSPQAGNGGWTPRRDDHLVEPFFGGLGQGAPGAAGPSDDAVRGDAAADTSHDAGDRARSRSAIARLFGRLFGRLFNRG